MPKRKADTDEPVVDEPVEPTPDPEPEPEPIDPQPQPDPEPTPEESRTPDYDPTPLPEVPVSWDIFTVFITVEDGEKHSIYDWWSANRIVPVILASNEDESVTFDYDDAGNGPANVVVYTNGRVQ